ncbi:hypothetical protein ACFUIW_34115 [Streptomyces sp. NPDC057245]|uniref:hypothetical protein n=1 Tax=Streptomyces sp. NPDC057245 TaxID=3346065 RepID=UPI0036436C1F
MSSSDLTQTDEEARGPLSLSSWQPKKRRAFLGDLAPTLYDHRADNRVQAYGEAWPNPVLENALGLMLCYDELWFLHRALCPADMQELDFVHFVSDDQDQMRTAHEGFQHGWEVVQEHVLPALPSPRPLKNALRGGAKPGLPPAVTHSLRLLAHTSELLSKAGHETDLSLVGRYYGFIELDFPANWSYMAQWFIPDALGLGPVDHIINSSMSRVLQVVGSGSKDDLQFETEKITAIEQVLHLRTTDTLGPRGAYHDFIADLRKDKRVKDLRDFFAGRPSPDGGATVLAREVEQLVADHQKEALRRMHRPAKLRAIGSMALGATANQAVPGLGSVLSTLVNADRTLSDFKFRKNSRWAAFVVDARDKRPRR